MAKLNQIIAIEKDIKSKAKSRITELHRSVQIGRPQLTGISRTYKPRAEDGETLPAESTRVQVRADDVLGQVAVVYSELLDTVLTKDVANAVAKADITVGTVTLTEAVPVTYLLFLEKALVELHTFILGLPSLDPSEVWEWDGTQAAFRTPVTSTVRSKKIPRNHVKAEATEHHPAQVETYFEDVTVGYWDTIKYSGALPQARINVLRGRVEALLKAVKYAREEANSTPIQQEQGFGARVFGYLFAE
jgi:hypothetical protein